MGDLEHCLSEEGSGVREGTLKDFLVFMTPVYGDRNLLRDCENKCDAIGMICMKYLDYALLGLVVYYGTWFAENYIN